MNYIKTESKDMLTITLDKSTDYKWTADLCNEVWENENIFYGGSDALPPILILDKGIEKYIVIGWIEDGQIGFHKYMGDYDCKLDMTHLETFMGIVVYLYSKLVPTKETEDIMNRTMN